MQKTLIYLTLLLLTICSDTNSSFSKLVPPDPTKFNLPLEYKAENEFAIVEYSFRGCFGGGNYQLLLYEKRGINYAGVKKNHKIILEARINEAQIDSFYVFVDELKTLDYRGFCTTQYSFGVKYDDETFYTTHDNCSWEGFSRLKKTLFGINF